jgi:hypothetical protein
MRMLRGWCLPRAARAAPGLTVRPRGQESTERRHGVDTTQGRRWREAGQQVQGRRSSAGACLRPSKLQGSVTSEGVGDDAERFLGCGRGCAGPWPVQDRRAVEANLGECDSGAGQRAEWRG